MFNSGLKVVLRQVLKRSDKVLCMETGHNLLMGSNLFDAFLRDKKYSVFFEFVGCDNYF